MDAVSLFVIFLAVSICSGSGVPARKIGAPLRHVVNPAAESRAIGAGPVNMADLVGETVILNCQSSGGSTQIQWHEYQTNPAGAIISVNNSIISSHPYSNRYAILHRNETEYDLIISPISILDGGSYTCKDVLAVEPAVTERGAQNIVIQANPNCTTNIPADGLVIEGTYYSIECELYYKGGVAPNMTWSGPQPFQTRIIQTATDVWSGASFFADRTMDMRTFSNLANFTAAGFNIPNYSSAPPAWSSTYQSVVLDVYWQPKNLYHVPNKPTYEIGNILTCYADAEPPPTYQWHSLRTNENWFTQSITLRSDMVGYQQLRCSGINTISGVQYTSDYLVNVTVNAVTTTTTPVPITTTPTPPAVGTCNDITGRWKAGNGDTVCFSVSTDGTITGLIQRGIDTYWSEIIGMTEYGNFEEVGFSVILPLTLGVQGYVGECHMCYGQEVMMTHFIIRSKSESPDCGDGGPISQGVPTNFTRNPGNCF